MIDWLQGGPFLEVSFILEYSGDKKQFITEFLDKLQKTLYAIELRATDIDSEIADFETGYQWLTEEQETINGHKISLPVMLNLLGERKSQIDIDEIADKTLQVDFSFFGSMFDDAQSDQVGVRMVDMPEFMKFLAALYQEFNFKFGLIALESDCLTLAYNCDEYWPNEEYKIERINPTPTEGYICYLYNSNYFPNKPIPVNANRVARDGILVTNDYEKLYDR